MSVATVAGDRPIYAAPVPMLRPGCYLVTANAQTLDATPAATASAPPDIITVMDTSAAVDPNDIVSVPGQLRPVVTVSHSYGRLVTVRTQLIGPAQPASGNCAAVDWSTVPRTAVSDVSRTGDGRVAISTQARTGGCYRLAGTVTVAVNDADTVELPVVVPAKQMDLILAPQVHDVVAEQVWSLSPAPVPVQVRIAGTYGQAGSVRIRMLWTPADPLGCGHADYRAATVVALGEAAEFSGDGVVTATSGATPRLGCYSVVPVVSIRANPSISSSGTPGAIGSTVIAGFDLNAIAAPLEPPRRDSVSVAPLLVAVVSFVVLAAASVVVVAFASQDRRAPRPASDGEIIGFPDAG